MSMFTSRLPKPTSARRPSNPNDASTSLFGTQIPVSVRKANLFTPQPKRSLQTGLSSTSRKSYLNTDRKYQRTSKPVPDHDEQLRMFKTLVDFLRKVEPGFPIPDSKRFFSSPPSVSTTETSRLFEFLISQLMPDFKINKLEIDVPEALTHLNYPHMRFVTKSGLVSITSRHAIGNLLVILDWLIELIGQATIAEEDQQLSSPVSIHIQKNPEATDEELPQGIHKRATFYKSAEAELERASKECVKLDSQVEEVKQLHEERKPIEHDLKASTIYEEKLAAWCRSKKTEEFETAKNERLKLELKLEDSVKKVEDLVKKEEQLSSPVPLELRKQKTYSNMLQIDEDIESWKKEEESKLKIFAGETNTVLTDIPKVEKIFEERKIEFKAKEPKKTDDLKAVLNSYAHWEAECTQMDKLNLEALRNALDCRRQEAISLIELAESERDKWRSLALIYKDNSKVAKKVSKKLMRGAT